MRAVMKYTAPAGDHVVEKSDPWQPILDGFLQISAGFSAVRQQFTDLSERVEELELQAYPAHYQSGTGLSTYHIGQLFLRLRLLRANWIIH